MSTGFDPISLDTAVWAYPGLNSPRRVRMTFNKDIYYKFYRDVDILCSFHDNYDNRPPVPTHRQEGYRARWVARLAANIAPILWNNA
jgi:hypothetical protein